MAATLVFLAMTLLIVACEGSGNALNSRNSVVIEPGIRLAKTSTQTIIQYETCSGGVEYIAVDGTDIVSEVFARAAAEAVHREGDECLPKEEREAKQAAELKAIRAELDAYCYTVYAEVDEPNVYQDYEVCPEHAWASLTRTTRCDDMMVRGVDDEAYLQCLLIVEPPT
ncbi:MAG: hypothetical protein AAF563_20820 [Pseudomonadota bacterium]